MSEGIAIMSSSKGETVTWWEEAVIGDYRPAFIMTT
jgi:hypothetical protein